MARNNQVAVRLPIIQYTGEDIRRDEDPSVTIATIESSIEQTIYQDKRRIIRIRNYKGNISSRGEDKEIDTLFLVQL